MFERFSDRARRIIVLAQEGARQLNHNYIGTEHLVLAMSREGEGSTERGIAAHALASYDIDGDFVQAQIEEIIGRGLQAPSGHIPFTPRAKKVLELSLREALQLGHNYIGTEHLLLGLLREADGVGMQILSRAPKVVVTAEANDLPPSAVIRKTVAELLGNPRAAERTQLGFGPEIANPLGPDAPSAPHMSEELELLLRAENYLEQLREHIGNRQEIIAVAEAAYGLEMIARGESEAKDHLRHQQLADLLAESHGITGSIAEVLNAIPTVMNRAQEALNRQAEFTEKLAAMLPPEEDEGQVTEDGAGDTT